MKGDYILSILGFVSLVTAVILASGCVSFSNISLKLPTSDILGHDIEGIPRYSGSIRFHYESSDCGSLVEYYVNGDKFEDVVNFYKNIGWKVDGVNSQTVPTANIPGIGNVGVKKSYEIDISKGNKSATVTVNLITYKGHDATIISIDYADWCEENQSQENQSQEESATESEIEIPAGLKPFDDTIRPVISGVFGEAKPVKAVYMNKYGGIDYAVGRDIKSSDAEKIVNGMKANGWSSVAEDVESDTFDLSFSNESNVVEISGDVGANKISVVIAGN